MHSPGSRVHPARRGAEAGWGGGGRARPKGAAPRGRVGGAPARPHCPVAQGGLPWRRALGGLHAVLPENSNTQVPGERSGLQTPLIQTQHSTSARGKCPEMHVGHLASFLPPQTTSFSSVSSFSTVLGLRTPGAPRTQHFPSTSSSKTVHPGALPNPCSRKHHGNGL